MTSILSALENHVPGQGIHLDVNPKEGFYTSGDKVTGVVHYDPVWGTDTVTEVDIHLRGHADPDWFTDYDSSKSKTGILQFDLNIYRGGTVGTKNFPFEIQFPSHTTPTTPYHSWSPHDQFEHQFGHPLPRTWNCHCSRIRYTLNALVTTSAGKVIHFSKKINYLPSLDTRLDEIPWREHVCMLSGFFRPGILMPGNVIEPHQIDNKFVKIRFPTTLVAEEPLHGSIQVQLPPSVESLKLWYLFIDAKFTSGYRTLDRPDGITTRPCYHSVRLLSSYHSAIILAHNKLVDLRAMCRKPVPPFYTLRTFNICVSGHLRIRALFGDPTVKMYRLSVSNLPIQIVAPPHSRDLLNNRGQSFRETLFRRPYGTA